MYKVFFNNNTLFLAKKPYKGIGFNITHTYINSKKLHEFIFKTCLNETSQEILILHDDLDKLWKRFKKLFKVKKAGGGLVVNKNDALLFIKRRGFWDLPKGHKEKKEPIETTAIREVSEECGIHDLEIIKPLLTTYHTYLLNNKWILKPSYWYLMKFSGDDIAVPQTEEDITEVRWFKKADLQEIINHTFPSIIEVIYSAYEDSLFLSPLDN